MSARQFQNLRASSLWCNGCNKAMSVSEKLLLVLPDRELFDYLCSGCGATIGGKEVTATEKLMTKALAARPARTQQVRII